MNVTFAASPELVKVGEIGNSLVEADNSFRRQFSILVLVAARNRELPLRNKNGFKLPQESLEITETQTRDFAKRRVEEELLAAIGDYDADVRHTREVAAAQPWMVWGKEGQVVDIDNELQAYAQQKEQYVERETQRETNRLLDDWYRDASVLVAEVKEWFCKVHDFAGRLADSSTPGEDSQPPSRAKKM